MSQLRVGSQNNLEGSTVSRVATSITASKASETTDRFALFIFNKASFPLYT